MRNRIIRHVQVRAGDLVPHELNPRTHSDEQRTTLSALQEELGDARSLLAYELPDGRLKLIDGHLRRSMDPERIVTVEVLDVNDDEARALLLSIDPLAQLASYDVNTLDVLRDATRTAGSAIDSLWAAVARSQAESQLTIDRAQSSAAAEKDDKPQGKGRQQALKDQFLILIDCKDEFEQRRLLRRLKKEGIPCSAKIS